MIDVMEKEVPEKEFLKFERRLDENLGMYREESFHPELIIKPGTDINPSVKDQGISF